MSIKVRTNLTPYEIPFLATKRNDPMGQDGGLYVIVPSKPQPKYVRVNSRPIDVPAQFEVLNRVIWAFTAGIWGELLDWTPKMFIGGREDTERLSFFHDAITEFESTISVGADCLVSYSPMAEYLDNEHVALPNIWKIVLGHELIDDCELESQISQGNWSIIYSPAYIVYGENYRSLSNAAFGRAVGASTLVGRIFDRFGTTRTFMKTFTDMATDFQLTLVRNGLFLYYYSKKEQPFDFEYLEKVIEVQLGAHAHQMGEITDTFDAISRADLDKKHRSLRRRTMRLPIAKRNRDLIQVMEEVGVNRYAYNYVFSQIFMPNATKKKGSEPRVKQLEREIDIVEDIVKDSDQGRS